VKNGQYDGPFSTALERSFRLLDRGSYATHLQRYFGRFPREQIHVSLFDDLRADPQAYADDVFAFLGVRRIELPSADLRSRMPAGTTRSAVLAAGARSVSRLAKRTGLARLRSRDKRSVLVRQALYRPFKDDRPTIDPDFAAELRLGFADEVLQLDSMLGRAVSHLWGYSSSPQAATDEGNPSPRQ
jgi:hypothetical protein